MAARGPDFLAGRSAFLEMGSGFPLSVISGNAPALPHKRKMQWLLAIIGTACCVLGSSPCPAVRAGVDYFLPFSGVFPEVGNKTDRLTDHRHELFCVRPARPAAIILPRANASAHKDGFLR